MQLDAESAVIDDPEAANVPIWKAVYPGLIG